VIVLEDLVKVLGDAEHGGLLPQHPDVERSSRRRRVFQGKGVVVLQPMVHLADGAVLG